MIRTWTQAEVMSNGHAPALSSLFGTDQDPWLLALVSIQQARVATPSSLDPSWTDDDLSRFGSSLARLWGSRLALLSALENKTLPRDQKGRVGEAACGLMGSVRDLDRLLGLALYRALPDSASCPDIARRVLTLNPNPVLRRAAAFALQKSARESALSERALRACSIYDEDASVRGVCVGRPASPIRPSSTTFQRQQVVSPSGGRLVRTPLLVLSSERPYLLDLVVTSSFGTALLPAGAPSEVIPID